MRCAACADFDLCETCYKNIELSDDTLREEEFMRCHGHYRTKQPFWLLRDYKKLEIYYWI
jgi:hypothetical protein